MTRDSSLRSPDTRPSSQGGRLVDPRKVRPATWRTVALSLAAVAALCVATGLVIKTAPLIASDWNATVKWPDMQEWSADTVTWDEQEWQARVEAVEESLRLTPDNPALHEQLAGLLAYQGRRVWSGGQAGSPEESLFTRALESQDRSIALRPGYAMAWANKAVYMATLGYPPAEVFEVWRRALALGPQLPEVRAVLVWVAEVFAEETPADAREWALQADPKLAERLRKAAEPPAPSPAQETEPGTR